MSKLNANLREQNVRFSLKRNKIDFFMGIQGIEPKIY